jgi:hypothetical protein
MWVAASEVIRNLALGVAALVGSFLAWKRVFAANRQADAAMQQATLARRDHVTELFNRAVGQLSDDKLEVRLGAIFTLREIVENFPDLSAPVYALLTTYLRERVTDYGDHDPPPDVREIMETVRIWLRLRDGT